MKIVIFNIFILYFKFMFFFIYINLIKNIKNILLLHLFLYLCFIYFNLHCFENLNIVFDPSYDASYCLGREIKDEFERGISLKFVKELKRKLSEKNNYLNIFLLRDSIYLMSNIDNINFLNRSNIFIYLGFQFYSTNFKNKNISIYYYLYKDTDFWLNKVKLNSLNFLNLDMAYLINLNKTKQFADSIYSILKLNCLGKKHISVDMPIGLPLKQLIGIISPAIILDMSIYNKDDILFYVNLFADILDIFFKDVNKI